MDTDVYRSHQESNVPAMHSPARMFLARLQTAQKNPLEPLEIAAARRRTAAPTPKGSDRWAVVLRSRQNPQIVAPQPSRGNPWLVIRLRFQIGYYQLKFASTGHRHHPDRRTHFGPAIQTRNRARNGRPNRFLQPVRKARHRPSRRKRGVRRDGMASGASSRHQAETRP